MVDRLGTIREYPKKSEVLPLFHEHMARINRIGFTPESAGTIAEFRDQAYVPYIEKRLGGHTVSGYGKAWRYHLKDRIGHMRLRDFRTVDGQALMDAINDDYGDELAHATYKWIKTSASAIFTVAKRLGHLDANPMEGVTITGYGKRVGRKTESYSLTEVKQFLTLFGGQTAVIIGSAAFAGLRDSEIRGLQDTSYDGEQFFVGHVVEEGGLRDSTKTSETPDAPGTIPVIAPLRKLLDAVRPVDCGFYFRNSEGGPVDLSNIADRIIKPRIKGTELRWKGWHAFRRGLASNLFELGVPAAVAALILRNSEEVVRKHYIKLQEQSKKAEAMAKLEAAWEQVPEKPCEAVVKHSLPN